MLEVDYYLDVDSAVYGWYTYANNPLIQHCRHKIATAAQKTLHYEFSKASLQKTPYVPLPRARVRLKDFKPNV